MSSRFHFLTKHVPSLKRLEPRLMPAGVTALVSRAEPALWPDTGGGQSFVGETHIDPNGDMFGLPRPNPSADGRYVAITSSAANLVTGQADLNDTYDVFLHDRVANTTTLVSRAAGSPTTAGNAASSNAAVSADGRFVVFLSRATDLVAGVTFPAGVQNNVYLFDRTTGGCTLVSHAVGLPLVAGSYDGQSVMLSADGGVVVFASRSVNLVANPGATGKTQYVHAYAYERATGVVSLLDHTAASVTTPGNRDGYTTAVTPDGRYVTFWSQSGNLLSGNTTSKGDAYRFDRQTGAVLLLSRSGPAAPYGGNGFSGPVGISDDGRWVLLESSATNLIPGASTAGSQVMVCDAESGLVTLVSHEAGNPSNGGNGDSAFAEISADGAVVYFSSQATNLVAGFADGNGPAGFDIFSYDRLAGQMTLGSRQAGSATASANAGVALAPAAVSADGRYAVFTSLSGDLVAGFVDNNGSEVTVTPNPGYDLYRFDRLTGTNLLVSGSLNSMTVSGNRGARGPGISADGRLVTYFSQAADVAPGIIDTNGLEDVYVRDFLTGTAELASRRFGPPSQSAGGESEWSQVSADGRYVAFVSTAANLVPGQIDPVQTPDVFLTDRKTQTTWLVSRVAGSAATAANGKSGIPVVSADGRYVAYSSYATDLVAGFVDGNGPRVPQGWGGNDVYLFDRVTGANMLVSHQAGAAVVGGNSTSATVKTYPDYLLTISDDGRYIGYMSLANDLVAGFQDNNGTSVTNNKGADVYVFDRDTGLNEVISHAAGAPLAGGNGSGYAPSISGDGRFVAFWGAASNLVAGMTVSSGRDVFLYDRHTGVTALVSHAAGSPTTPANGGSTEPVVSKDGNWVVLNSAANTLVTGGSDPNNLDDVFLYDRLTGANTLVSHRFDSATAAGDMSSSIGVDDRSMSDTTVSADGRFVVFQSQAGDLVAGFMDGNGQETISGYSGHNCDTFLFDRLTGSNTLISRTAASPTSGGNRESRFGSLSGDGRFASFTSWATDLTAAGPIAGDGLNTFLYDRLAGSLALVSRSTTGATLTGVQSSWLSSMSRDGSAVVFSGTADNLVAGDFNTSADIFAYVTPPPRVQSVTVDSGSAQRSVVRSLTVTFDQPVLFTGSPAAAFALGGVTVAASSPDNVTFTLTFSGAGTQFGSLVDGNYQLTVLASQVFNVGQLDGNGDGVGGDNYTFNFHRLFGDADGDRDVDAVDYGAFRGAFGGTANLAFDFDNDGDVDTLDFGQFRSRFGSTV